MDQSDIILYTMYTECGGSTRRARKKTAARVAAEASEREGTPKVRGRAARGEGAAGRGGERGHPSTQRLIL